MSLKYRMLPGSIYHVNNNTQPRSNFLSRNILSTLDEFHPNIGCIAIYFGVPFYKSGFFVGRYFADFCNCMGYFWSFLYLYRERFSESHTCVIWTSGNLPLSQNPSRIRTNWQKESWSIETPGQYFRFCETNKRVLLRIFGKLFKMT